MITFKRGLILSLTLLFSLMSFSELSFAESENCEELVRRLQAQIEKARSCDVSSDCTEISLPCVAACATVINKGNDQVIRRSFEEYKMKCTPCDVDCGSAKGAPIICEKGKCTWQVLSPLENKD